MSMETKMAGSVENVQSMITSLLAKGIWYCIAYLTNTILVLSS